MNHPYIGQTFRLEYVLPAPSGKAIVIPRAVCVLLSDSGDAVFRNVETREHLRLPITNAIGPLDEPAADQPVDAERIYRAGVRDALWKVADLADVWAANADAAPRTLAFGEVAGECRALERAPWPLPADLKERA